MSNVNSRIDITVNSTVVETYLLVRYRFSSVKDNENEIACSGGGDNCVKSVAETERNR